MGVEMSALIIVGGIVALIVVIVGTMALNQHAVQRYNYAPLNARTVAVALLSLFLLIFSALSTDLNQTVWLVTSGILYIALLWRLIHMTNVWIGLVAMLILTTGSIVMVLVLWLVSMGRRSDKSR